MQTFNIVDGILILVMILCIISGWRKGFMIGIIDLLKWLIGLMVAFATYQYIAGFISRFTNVFGIWLFPVSFMLAFVILTAIISAVTGMFFKGIPYNAHKSLLNKAMGIVPGFVNGVIYIIVIVVILFSTPLFDGLSAKARESAIANSLSDDIEWLDEKISPVFDDAIRKTINRTTIEPGSRKTVKLHYTIQDARPRPDLEAKMLDMVNEERAKVGVPALKADTALTRVARAHSQDMFSRGYFSHYTPEGKDPFERLDLAGISYLAAGENLATGQTLKICHIGLMNSPGHKANILRPQFGRLGIGILDGRMYGLMISQEFRD